MGREARIRAKLRAAGVPRALPSTPTPARCPDFDLAPLTAFSPDVFRRTGHDDLDAFMLSLALVCNDLKDTDWQTQQLKKCKPERSEVSGYVGQWRGMNIHANRIVFGIMHELLVAIEHHGHVLDQPEFKACVASLRGEARQGWKALVSAASGSGKSDAFRDFLLRVRHNFVAHYYQPRQLLKAYQHYFFVRPPDDFNQSAYASFGQSMEGTRFYFVDAAPAEYYRNMSDPQMFDEAGKYVHHVNNALRHLLEVFLRNRQQQQRRASSERQR